MLLRRCTASDKQAASLHCTGCGAFVPPVTSGRGSPLTLAKSLSRSSSESVDSRILTESYHASSQITLPASIWLCCHCS
uniref:Uncharacterized protein n=1 Tax=Arundo donax TaxID=35708 RepID=A0A0A9C090_ARUDO